MISDISSSPGTQLGDGEVEIAYVLDCPCEFMCIYEDYEQRKFKCYCAPNHILDQDGLHCRSKSTNRYLNNAQ